MKYILFITTLVFLLNCTPKPKPINYGNDACYYCKMTIVDKVHAAEIVTKKGKVYKFDASECMINFRKDFNQNEIELYLVNNYIAPETLIDATKSTFLISKQIPSPMGAYLSAFKNKKDAEQLKTEKQGELYTWNELLKLLNDN